MKKQIILAGICAAFLFVGGLLTTHAVTKLSKSERNIVALSSERNIVSIKTIKSWLKKGEWRNGFNGNADKNVNLQEFYTQYHKNPEQWDAAFKWLAMTDLLNAKAGKYPIPGTTMTASVQDGTNLPLKGHWTESHRRKIDFMYVVRGIEGFGLLDHATSKPNCEYDEKRDVIHYDFDETKLKRFAVTAGNFIICFPSDWHLPLLKTKYKNQDFRVIVIKVDYKE